MNLAGIQRSWKAPEGATHAVFEEANAIAYFCPQGQIVSVRVFTGRSLHARSKFTARTLEDAHSQVEQRIVPRLLRERSARSLSMKKAAEQRAGLTHAHVAGTILYASWGYEQTNIDFFEVVNVPSKQCIEVRRRESIETESAPGAMRGTAVPGEGFADKKTHRLRLTKTGHFYVRNGFGTARLLNVWDGTPKQYTAYG